MSIIPDQNFKQFLSTEINLSSNVLTDRLGTINRFNLFSRLAHRSELDSRNICKNIEAHIQTISLTESQKQMALKNLSAMKNKFCSSADVAKGKECSATIDRITSFLSKNVAVNPNTQSKTFTKPETNLTPRSIPSPFEQKTSVSNKKGEEKQKKIAVKKQNSQPVKQAIPITGQQPIPDVISRSHAQEDPAKLEANKKLVKAISRDTRSQGSVATKTKTHAPDTEKIQEIEKDLSEALRKDAGDYVKMIHYPWHLKCQYYYVALRKEKINGFEVVKQVLVPAKEVDLLMKQRAQIGSFDVGALLREKRKEMELKDIPIETKSK